MAAKTKRKGKKKPAAETPLSLAQTKFCESYALNGNNGADAYAAAYPPSRKNTPQYRSEKASRLLATDKIKVKIQSLAVRVVEVLDRKFDITAEKVLQELAAIAFANADDYYEWGTRKIPIMNRKTGQPVLDPVTEEPMFEDVPFAYIKPSSGLSRVQKAAIVGAEMTFSKAGDPVVGVKMADKRAALRDLGQHLKLFTEKVEHTGKNGAPIAHAIVDPKEIETANDPIEALKIFERFREQAQIGHG